MFSNDIHNIASIQEDEVWVLDKNQVYCEPKSSWLGRIANLYKGKSTDLAVIYECIAKIIENQEYIDLKDLELLEIKALEIFKNYKEKHEYLGNEDKEIVEWVTDSVERTLTSLLKASHDRQEEQLVRNTCNISLTSLKEYLTDRSWETKRGQILHDLEHHIANLPPETDLKIEVLYFLAKRGSIEAFESLLQLASPDYQKIEEIVLQLIRNEWDTDSKNESGETLLHVALKLPKVEIKFISFLLNEGFDENATNNLGQTALHIAVASIQPNFSIVQMIRTQKTDVNKQDIYGKTPLHLAILNSSLRPEIVEYLLKEKADPFITDKYCLSPLFYALNSSDDRIVNFFSEKADWSILHAAVISQNPTTSSSQIYDLVNSGVDINSQDRNGRTPLHWAFAASTSPSLDVITSLIQNGADPFIHDQNGVDPFDLLLRNNNSDLKLIYNMFTRYPSKFETIMEKILYSISFNSNHVIVDLIKQIVSPENREEILSKALLNPNSEIMKKILELPEYNFYNNQSLLQKVVYNQYINPKSLKILIDQGRGLSKNNSILLKGLKNSNYEIIKCLVQNDVNINQKDKYGNTPLHKIFKSQGKFYEERVGLTLKLTKLFLKNGANINAINSKQHSPILYALYRNKLIKMPISEQIQIVNLFIQYGAKLDTQDLSECVASILASNTDRSSKLVLANLLIKLGANIHFFSSLGIFSSTLIKFHQLPIPLDENIEAFANERFQIAKLSSIWNIRGTTHIQNTMGQDFKIDREGYPSYFVDKEFHRLLNLFYKEKSLIFRRDFSASVNLIQPILENANRNTASVKHQYDSGNTLFFLFAGWKGHSVGVAIHDDYYIVSNRGQGRKKMSSKLFKIQRLNSIDEESLKFLLNEDPMLSFQDGNQFLYEDLPKKLGYDHQQKDDIADFLNEKFNGKNQKSGNCWWISPKESIFSVITLNEFLMLEIDLLSKEEKEKAFKKTFNDSRLFYKQFSLFIRFQTLKEYLERPADLAGRDHQLIQTIFSKIQSPKWDQYLDSKEALFSKSEVYQWFDQYKQTYNLNDSFELKNIMPWQF